MNWGSASAFFSMGGYGLYVWGSYVVVMVLMLAEALATHQRLRRALRGQPSNGSSASSATVATSATSAATPPRRALLP